MAAMEWKRRASGVLVPAADDALTAPRPDSASRWTKARTALATIATLATGYLLSLPKQVLDLEQARQDSRSKNSGTLSLVANRVSRGQQRPRNSFWSSQV